MLVKRIEQKSGSRHRRFPPRFHGTAAEKAVVRFARDPLTGVMVVLVVLVGLLWVTNLFEARFPNLALVTRLTRTSCLLFGILASFVLILGGYKPDILKTRLGLILANFGGAPTREPMPRSVFASTVNQILLILAGGIPAIAALWLVHLMGVFAASAVVVTEVIVVYQFLKGQRYVLIGLMLLTGVPLLLLLEGEYSASAVGAAFIATIVQFTAWTKKTTWPTLQYEPPNSLGYILRELRRALSAFYHSVYDNSTIRVFQALVIAVILVLYFASDKLVILLPPALKGDWRGITLHIHAYKDAIPYFACIAYAMLSFAPLVEPLVRPLTLRESGDSFRAFANILIVAGIVILIGPLLFVPMFFLLACVLLAGERMFGIDLAVIVGFFTFPEWSSRIYAGMLVLLHSLLPSRVIRRGFRTRGVG